MDAQEKIRRQAHPSSGRCGVCGSYDGSYPAAPHNRWCCRNCGCVTPDSSPTPPSVRDGEWRFEQDAAEPVGGYVTNGTDRWFVDTNIGFKIAAALSAANEQVERAEREYDEAVKIICDPRWNGGAKRDPGKVRRLINDRTALRGEEGE